MTRIAKSMFNMLSDSEEGEGEEKFLLILWEEEEERG